MPAAPQPARFERSGVTARHPGVPAQGEHLEYAPMVCTLMDWSWPSSAHRLRLLLLPGLSARGRHSRGPEEFSCSTLDVLARPVPPRADWHASTLPHNPSCRLYVEPLAKLLGSRLGSVLRFSGVNTPLSWISTACSGPEGPAASQETENKGIDVFSTERGDTGG